MTSLEQAYEDWGCCRVDGCINPLSEYTDATGICYHHEDYEPCNECETPVEPSSLVMVFVGTGQSAYCPPCLAGALLAREVVQCGDCGTYYHVDADWMAGTICIGCEERHIGDCDAELAGVA
ncbi:MAG: hypothetical protein KGL39_53450 [Patescibacteria group bacterium]|nr:hypothetical protein [Patescibacteria group bacterium]